MGTEGGVREDAELIVAVRAGDHEATGTLYEPARGGGARRRAPLHRRDG